MKRAVVSVYDKTGIVEFARGLAEIGYEIVSTGGTAKVLRENGIEVKEVAEITGFPEILGGRVKTLHPVIHGGILARNTEEDMKQLAELDIIPVEVVAVNLYPFEKTVLSGAELKDVIENIDIGGPTMLRAAAKNFERVFIVVDPDDYGEVIKAIKSGEENYEFRLKLASKAFGHVALYDALISDYFSNLTSDNFPSETALPLRLKKLLRYGENPHQKGAVYVNPFAKSGIANAEVLGGKEMSYNNIADADAVLGMIRDFKEETFCVIVKHANPCGAAVGKTPADAFQKALQTDPVSAFGGIVGFTRPVDSDTAKLLTEIFLEVIVAPDYTDDALKILRETKKNLRLIKVNLLEEDTYHFVRSVSGGFLVQEQDKGFPELEEMKVVTQRKPSDREIEVMKFAWKIVKSVKSNAIVLADETGLLGVGAGQMSRVDSVRIAVSKARRDTKGSVLASDAFFPFRDGIDEAARAGVRAVIQPGGSIRDAEVIKAADEYGIAMVFTGRRHFRHT